MIAGWDKEKFLAVTGFLNTTNPVAELVAELNPGFEQRHKLDRRNVGVLLGDLTEVYDSMRLSTALEDLHKLPTGEFEPTAAADLKELFLNGRRSISRHLSQCARPPTRRKRLPAPLPKPERYAHYLFENGLMVEQFSDAKRARIAFEPWGRFYQTRNQEMKEKVDILRNDFSTQLRRLGPRGTQLDYLDQTLHGCIETRSESYLARLSPHLEAEFKQVFLDAREQLPPDPAVSDVEGWFVPGGWPEGFVESIMRYLRTILHFRLQPLQALVEAACNLPENRP